MEREPAMPPAGTHPTLVSKSPSAEFLLSRGSIVPVGTPSGWGVGPMMTAGEPGYR